MASGTVYRGETREGSRRRQKKRSSRTKREAQAALTELLAVHQTGTYVEPSKTPLREFVDDWFDGLANERRKATTLHGYRRTLANYVLPPPRRRPPPGPPGV